MHPMLPTNAVTLTPNAGSVEAAMPDWNGGSQIQLYNSGSTIAFFAFGNSSAVVATAASFALPPGAILTYTRQNGQTFLAVYSAGNPTIYVTCGSGG